MKNGEKIDIFKAKDAPDEAEHVVKVIREFTRLHPEVPRSQIAILYRTNAQCKRKLLLLIFLTIL